MKKAVITIGVFDCVDQKQSALIKAMYKTATTDGVVVVFLLDDYTAYKRTGKFPNQNIVQRKKNLTYLVPENQIFIIENNQVDEELSDYMLLVKHNSARLVYVGFRNEKLLHDKEQNKMLLKLIKYEK